MPAPRKPSPPAKHAVKSDKTASAQLHPRNRHQGRYDLSALCASEPGLKEYLVQTAHGLSVDFANPAAVFMLNRAILQADYGIQNWSVLPGQLCPAIPGRADYLHHLADLLSDSHGGRLPAASGIQALDIGTGSSLIYPLLGSADYGWQFVATDINPASLAHASVLLSQNPSHASRIALRQQPDQSAIFRNILQQGEWFDVTLCNPPFHRSPQEAAAGSERKWRQLGKASAAPKKQATQSAVLNFGGKDAELWCPGGELAFILKMMDESALFPAHCYWYSSLVAKAEHLPALKARLKQLKVQDWREIAMGQGNKQSRLLAWTFLTPAQQSSWKKLRWNQR